MGAGVARRLALAACVGIGALGVVSGCTAEEGPGSQPEVGQETGAPAELGTVRAAAPEDVLTTRDTGGREAGGGEAASPGREPARPGATTSGEGAAPAKPLTAAGDAVEPVAVQRGAVRSAAVPTVEPAADTTQRAAVEPAAHTTGLARVEPAADTPERAVVEPAADTTQPTPPPVFARPEHIRGVYLNAWVSGARTRVEELIQLARRTEINTFVIDVKDDTGYLSYRTSVELAREIGADQELRIVDVHGLLRRLEAEGIYPIARIVVFKDHLLAERRPDMAVQDSTGASWVDGRGDVWVNPYDERVWAYHVEIAREAVELGFPEVQWDYVRFPDRPQSEMERAVFPGKGERTRSRAIRDFLVWSGGELEDLDVPLTADVFGMATSARTDVGIGQLWEDFIDVVDAALPMVYPSHYWVGSFGIDDPNGHPYEVVGAALRDAVRRNEPIEAPGRIIPWLQDFTLGPPAYEAAEVRAQILAAYDAGIWEWILWNSAGRYTEAALEPAAGWGDPGEPSIRFGGKVVPAATRLAPPVPQPVEGGAATGRSEDAAKIGASGGGVGG